MMTRVRRRRGALMVSLGVLLVLSILGVGFIKVSATERAASSNYVDRVHARNAAQSGLEVATGRLMDHFRSAVVGTLNRSDAPWIDGDPIGTPVSSAQLPSNRQGSVSIGGTMASYSGVLFDPKRDADWLSPRYDPDAGIHYVLRISDLNTRINLNDPNPNLGRMLNALGEGIAFYSGYPDPVAGRGDGMVALRQVEFGGQFRTVEDLRHVLSRAELDVLTPYVTFDSWRDPAVIRPGAQTSGIAESYAFVRPTFTNGAPAGRSPINVNTAPTAVIYACQRGLSARGFLSSDGKWIFGDKPPISDQQAKALTAAIDVRRRNSPIRSNHDLAGVLNGSSHPELMTLVMANADPNTRLTKFNPDLSFVNRGQSSSSPDMLDKTDLTFWTTEFCFIAMGMFEVESLGRVLDRLGHVLARYRVAQIIRLYQVARHTTQRDFEVARLQHLRTRSFPENMADQLMNVGRASQLDGQIALSADERVVAGTRWSANLDTSLFGSDMFRWSAVDMGGADSLKLYENRPAEGGQTPALRTILGEDRATTLRTSVLASNLHPDGMYSGAKLGGRLTSYRVWNETTSTSNMKADNGTIDFWFKPDLRGRTMTEAAKGLFGRLMFGPSCPIPAAGGGAVDYYAGWLTNSWLQGGGGDVRGIAMGSISPKANRSSDMPAYPYSSSYYFLTEGPAHASALRGHRWNHIRITWRDWVRWRVYVNGVLVSSAEAYFIDDGTTPHYLNIRDAVDFMQFGAMYCQSPYIYWWDYRSSGTVDKIRGNSGVLNAEGPPNRYRVTQGGSMFRGRFRWSGLAADAKYHALTIRFGSTPGTNGSGVNSHITLEALAGQSHSAPVPGTTHGVSPGLAIDRSFDPASGVECRCRYHDSGQAPFTSTPFLDDVTLFYTTGHGPTLIRRWPVE